MLTNEELRAELTTMMRIEREIDAWDSVPVLFMILNKVAEDGQHHKGIIVLAGAHSPYDMLVKLSEQMDAFKEQLGEHSGENAIVGLVLRVEGNAVNLNAKDTPSVKHATALAAEHRLSEHPNKAEVVMLTGVTDGAWAAVHSKRGSDAAEPMMGSSDGVKDEGRIIEILNKLLGQFTS